MAFHDFPGLMAFVVDSTGLRIVHLDEEGIAASIAMLHEAMRMDDPLAYQQAALALHGSLLSEVLKDAEATELVIVPSAALDRIPFDALVKEPGDPPTWSGMKYVLHAYDVRYARSIAEALDADPSPLSGEFGWALASSAGASELPFARALIVEHSHRQRLELSTASFIELLRQPQPLHIAAHAEAPGGPDEEPWILLNDGRLRRSSIDSIRVSAPLVVLSACASGDGQRFIGEGTLGFGQSLLRNGARTVVQTLWPVDDRATSEVLDFMHQRLSHGSSVAAALAEAKREYVYGHTDDGLANPFYWSGIVVSGSDARRHDGWRGWWWLLAAPIAAFVYLRWRRSRSSRALDES